MFGSALIAFRETLEAALIIGILAAATRGLPGRGRWLTAGVAIGLTGAALVAAGAGAIADLADGVGQELFNASVLTLAVCMLAWHNIWMTRHGAELASQARGVANAVREGGQEFSAVLVIVAVAVLREGAETVLFLYGLSASADESGRAMLLGGLAGVGAGIGCGLAVYAGLLRIPMRWFFQATATLILFLAAGMAAQAAKFLVQADWLPAIVDPIWDSSSWLPQDSPGGVLLHSLAGYDARPALIQVLFFVAAILGIALAMHVVAARVPARE